jgi:hypothetical protein
MKTLSGCIVVPALILVGIILMTAIFSPSKQTSNTSPRVKVAPSNQSTLEANNIHSCRVNPVHSRFSNQIVVSANGQNFIVFCDPNDRKITSCCYRN